MSRKVIIFHLPFLNNLFIEIVQNLGCFHESMPIQLRSCFPKQSSRNQLGANDSCLLLNGRVLFIVWG
jgi:hypothetical protein